MGLHADHASSRPLSNDYELVGLAGEWDFGQLVGAMPDFSQRPAGDNGVDFVLPLLFSIDVKTARKPYNLIHEQGKGFADIYVLAGYEDDPVRVRFIGWEWGTKLACQPVKEFNHGVLNHYIRADALRPMTELFARLTDSPRAC